MPALFRACVLTALAVSLVNVETASAEHHGQKKVIEKAVLNYVSAIYEMKPELIDESVSPRLQKLGYMPPK